MDGGKKPGGRPKKKKRTWGFGARPSSSAGGGAAAARLAEEEAGPAGAPAAAAAPRSKARSSTAGQTMAEGAAFAAGVASSVHDGPERHRNRGSHAQAHRGEQEAAAHRAEQVAAAQRKARAKAVDARRGRSDRHSDRHDERQGDRHAAEDDRHDPARLQQTKDPAEERAEPRLPKWKSWRRALEKRQHGELYYYLTGEGKEFLNWYDWNDRTPLGAALELFLERPYNGLTADGSYEFTQAEMDAHIDMDSKLLHSFLHLGEHGHLEVDCDVSLDMNKVSIHKGNGCYSPLQMAIRAQFTNDLETTQGIVRLLLDSKADPNLEPAQLGARREDMWKTPLQMALDRQCPEIVRTLIERKASMRSSTSSSRSYAVPPLHYAARFCKRSEKLSAVELLLECKANVNQACSYGPPLKFAAKSWDLPVVELLLDSKADVNWCLGGTAQPGKSLTVLHAAVKRCRSTGKDTSIIKLLLDRKADVDKQNAHCEDVEEGEAARCGTPLHLAVSLMNPTIVKLLLDRNASVDLQSTFRPKHPFHVFLRPPYSFDQTPLMTAVTTFYHHDIQIQGDVVALLLQAGASINKRSRQGRSAFDLAYFAMKTCRSAENCCKFKGCRRYRYMCSYGRHNTTYFCRVHQPQDLRNLSLSPLMKACGLAHPRFYTEEGRTRFHKVLEDTNVCIEKCWQGKIDRWKEKGWRMRARDSHSWDHNGLALLPLPTREHLDSIDGIVRLLRPS